MPGDYDVLIVGGGLAGLTAALFAARHGLKTGVVERLMSGAQIINLEKIENFPGFPQGVPGAELAPAVQEQAIDAGAEFVMDEVTGLARDGHHKIVHGEAGNYRAKAVIIAAGSSLRHLGIPGEEEFTGRGVSHCATCDGPLYMGQAVAVIGGGDSAADEALTLTEYAGKVSLLCRREGLRAQKALQDRLERHRKIEILWNAVAEEIIGEDTVTGLKVRNTVTNLEDTLEVSGVFVYVGLRPNSELVKGLLKVDNAGHIPVNLSMETAVPGLYAVGDIRQQSASQLVAAAGDGATAALAAFHYIRNRRW